MKTPTPVEPTQLAIDAASHPGAEGWGGRLAGLVSAIALSVSAYTLWDTSLKAPDVRVFVPATIHYASPYTNSNFEVISIPVTITNEGARTGTVLAIDLEASDGTSAGVKRFYAADIGRWSMERTRSLAYQHFAPMNLPGRASRTENILFYPKGDTEQPQQVVRDGVDVRFTLRLDMAEEEASWLDRFVKPAAAPSVTFTRKLRFFDARAFNTGTIPMDAKDWRPARSGP